MKKKILGLLMTLSLTITVAACGSESSNVTNEEIQQEEQTSDISTKEDVSTQKENSTEEDALKAASEAEIEGDLVIALGDQQADVFLWKVAQAKGFINDEFTEDNISVEVQSFAGGPAVFEAVKAGSVQVGIAAFDPVINNAASGADVVIIADTGSYKDAYPIIVRKDSGITNIKELEGHSVAVTAGSYRHNALLTTLDSVGLSSSDIEMFNLPNSDILTAIQSGETDAAVVSISNYEAVSEYADIIDYVDEYKGTDLVLGAERSFVEQYPNTTARLLRVVKRTTDWMIENREESMEIFAEAVGLDSPEKAASFYDSMVFGLSYDTDSMKNAISSTIEFDLENDILTNAPDVDALLDDTYFKLAGIEGR